MTAETKAISSDLSVLEDRYRKRRESRKRKVVEPENAGRSIKGFVDLSSEVANTYKPSDYLKTAPLDK